MEKIKRAGTWLRESKTGFFVLIVLFYWLKTYGIYLTKFTLGAAGPMQQFLLLLNPIPSGMLLLGLGMLLKGRKSYWTMIVIDFLLATWLFANILYYREFSNFLSFSLMQNSGAASENLGKSIAGIIKPTDFLAFLDPIVMTLLLACKVIKMDLKPQSWQLKTLIEVLALILMGVNLLLAQHDRSGLLTRTFDNNYIVKYLGINEYAVYDGIKTVQTNAQMANAKSSDLAAVKKYLKQNRVAPNAQYTGVAKGKNVIMIHLESFQQFLIDYKWKGKEVTPNLNKLYHAKDTLAFDNFFNQVGQGKTSDAEMMLENSLFGVQSGSAMTTYGTSNVFESMPAILKQKGGYTTAVMHGGSGSFWNRNNAYKSFGYQYFMSLNYYNYQNSWYLGYGLKDKIFLKQSAKYIAELPQPFYLKLITVTNHYPYDLDKQNASIAKTDTNDNTVDGYVQTAHYLDQAIGEFMAWLKRTGLDKKTLLVFYGDHYGISNNHNEAMAILTGKKSYGEFDDQQQQRVPLMIHAAGLKGGIKHVYGGEIDVMPTLLNLLGIKSNDLMLFGHDLLSRQNPQLVAQRNGNYISPEFTKVASSYYYTKTGRRVKNKQDLAKAKLLGNRALAQLSLSDRVMTGNLLRFYKPSWFKTTKAEDYDYNKADALAKLEKGSHEKSTLKSQLGKKKDAEALYKTDAPELRQSSKKKAK